MANYKWISLTSGDAAGKPVLAFIAPASGFYRVSGQEKIRERLELLTRLGFEEQKPGFEIQIPIFSYSIDGADLDAFPNKIDFNIPQQKAALEQIQVVIEPNVANRAEADFPALLPHANSPETGASIIIDCIKKGWNMMPLAGGESFENKLPHIKKYFARNPHEKKPAVNIFGYSNISFANSLALDGICSYMPTQFTNNFTKIADIKSKELKENLSAGEQEWLAFLKGQAAKLTSAFENPASVSHENKKIIYLPPNQAPQGNSTHYPLNLDVLNPKCLDQNFFTPNPQEKWSFAIEWMMQKGDNPATFSNAVELLDKFLDRNKAHLPEFIELGVLGTRFDGMNGLWDLIYDEDALLKVDDANIAIISYRTKAGFVQTLNKFLTNYKDCSESDKILHGALPIFLRDKLDPALNKIGEVDGAITDQEIKEVFKWRNDVFQRVKNQVLEIAVKYNLPLVQNSNFGHVANMSPTVAGPCEYRFEGANLNLQKSDKTLASNAAAAEELKDMPQILDEKPSPFVESASAGDMRSRDGLSPKL